jgi:3-oxoacyl-[acyl-carrier protein] reductase
VENSEKLTILITGAGIGIGAATARAFADASCRVIVTDVLEEEGRSVASSIESQGGEAEYHHLDVTDTGEVDSVVSDVLDRYGPLHTGVAYGWDEHVQYSAAKAGVVGLVRGLAVELARDGVRVNGIAPGYIRTAQALSEEHSLGPEGLERAAEFIPMGRVGEPEDVADVIVFLASEAARYIAGQVLVVDGGLLVGRY